MLHAFKQQRSSQCGCVSTVNTPTAIVYQDIAYQNWLFPMFGQASRQLCWDAIHGISSWNQNLPHPITHSSPRNRSIQQSQISYKSKEFPFLVTIHRFLSDFPQYPSSLLGQPGLRGARRCTIPQIWFHCNGHRKGEPGPMSDEQLPSGNSAIENGYQWWLIVVTSD